jgi:hypothetical protein
MKTEITALIICILALAGLIAHSMRPLPEKDYIVSPAVKKVMALHGVEAMRCRGDKCSFSRSGRIVTLRQPL